ncbi:sad1 unc domain protein [Colletotrichum higginsianum]|nr:sad1 unc domain protein [Colletotrichum higginsianum]
MERSTDQHPQNKSTSVSAPDPRYAERHPTPSSAPALSAGAHASSANTEAKTGGPGDNTSSTKASPQATPPVRNKNNSTAAAASPTVQESFFKAVSKRLQYLESNVSLSLKYIEDQSRSLQETQLLAERKQLSRIDVFLDSLNHTVLSELRAVRQQYDQIWQSTVIALESQREQSQRETVALSSRLNILADEVVFQKRMAIVPLTLEGLRASTTRYLALPQSAALVESGCPPIPTNSASTAPDADIGFWVQSLRRRERDT